MSNFLRVKSVDRIVNIVLLCVNLFYDIANSKNEFIYKSILLKHSFAFSHLAPDHPSNIQPQGILVPRGREQLDRDMQDCFLMTRDGSTLACGMLKRYRCVNSILADNFVIVIS